VLSVIPKFERRKNGRIDIEFNPPFLGYFTELSMDEYFKIMEGILESRPKLYETMIRDIYQIGQVLKKKKYKYLKLSYRVCTTGLLVSLLVFAVQFLLMRLRG
jgi:hypothetical protein